MRRKTAEERKGEGGKGTNTVIFHKVPIAGLHEDPKNAMKHPPRNRELLRGSLAEFGQVLNLVVEKGTGLVLGGNCTLGELRALGAEEVQVSEVDVHGRDATRLSLLLNRAGQLATWDVDALSSILADLDDDLESVGMEDFAELADPLEEVSDWTAHKDVSARPPVLMLAIRIDGSDIIEQAIERALSDGAQTRGQAIARICEEWLG